MEASRGLVLQALMYYAYGSADSAGRTYVLEAGEALRQEFERMERLADTESELRRAATHECHPDICEHVQKAEASRVEAYQAAKTISEECLDLRVTRDRLQGELAQMKAERSAALRQRDLMAKTIEEIDKP